MTTLIVLLGLIAVIVAMLVIYLLVRAGFAKQGGRRGPLPVKVFKSLVLGADNRTSTSKTTLLVWTLLVVWAFATLLIAGELYDPQACVTTGETVAERLEACRAGDKASGVGLMQLSWQHLIANSLDEGYILLLGIPAATALAAKGITQTKDEAGTEPKTVAADPATGSNTTDATARLGQLFSADDGSTDLGDTQYLLFNGILGAYFIARLFSPDGLGLPALPDTLLGLIGVSAAAYVGKKAVARHQPAITSVYPTRLAANTTFTVIGANLTWPVQPSAEALAAAQPTVPAAAPAVPAAPAVAAAPAVPAAPGLPEGTSMPVVLVGGVIATGVEVLMPGRITAVAPVHTLGSTHQVTVVNVWGVQTPTGHPVTY